MKRITPFKLLLVGVGIISAGLVYHMLYAGLPYQDPTPEVYADWRFHSRIGNRILDVGLITFVIGAFWGLYRTCKWAFRKLRAS